MKKFNLTNLGQDEALLVASLVVYGLNQATGKGSKEQLDLGKHINTLLKDDPSMEYSLREKCEGLLDRIYNP